MTGYERMMTVIRRGAPDKAPIWELIVNRPVIKDRSKDYMARYR